MTKESQTTKQKLSLDKRFWTDFVTVVYDTLDDKNAMTSKQIAKILVDKNWGHPKINLITKALDEDLKDKVQKIGKKNYLKLIK